MIEKNNNNWKERFDEIFANRKVIGDRTFKDYHEYLYADILDFIDQTISERDKEWEKWKALAEAMDNAPVGHRVIIKHLLGEDEWTLTRRNK